MAESTAPRNSPLDHKEGEVPVVLDAQLLLQGRKEIWIEQAGVRYRLRVTRRGRLILTK
jgi:hemin uptake protein HemP